MVLGAGSIPAQGANIKLFMHMRKLNNEKRLSNKEWLKGFMLKDGVFYVIVATIFFDGRKENEDDFFYTKEQFRGKFNKKV